MRRKGNKNVSMASINSLLILTFKIVLSILKRMFEILVKNGRIRIFWLNL